ncbi:MAG: ATP-binding protein [Lachnospiraceae bacterium]|nr:ATP-binding protein [Lachnospiraceae bacterium]
MQSIDFVLPYKLEKHLEDICNNNDTYVNLLSVWNINKKMCQDALSTIVMNYPHYTKHDSSHCEAIITNIEMLLGEDAIRVLSPTDTWLLLHAAYLHDIGMVIECKRIEENWESKEFQDYLSETEKSSDDELAQNAKFINSFIEKWDKEEPVLSWPVRVRYAVTVLIADYYRRRHAEDSSSYMKDMGDRFHIDLGFNGLIPQRLIRLLADIAYLHTEPREKILALDYQTNGFNSDYAHPRFLALMLRMGDLLDADNNRFNSTNELVFGTIPQSSKNHWEKHMSTRHILITPDVIEYRADCGKPEVYRETRVFLTWLKEEIEFWALNWKNIMPDNIKGSAPRLGKCELLLNGVPDIQGLSDLRFSISPEKAFEVIEGANIYEDQFVFLREVVQNALDACKIQMWRDISENRYRSWVEEKCKKEELRPFEISDAVFNNYGVDIKLCNEDADHIKIIIRDNGTGLSAEQLKKICNVGISYAGDKQRNEEINSMPQWLRPTAGFGIGLQSIFLIADEFEIYSKASGAEEIHAKVTSRRKNGYVQVTKSNELKEQGTEIHISILRDTDFRYSYAGNTYDYVTKKFDPFSKESDVLYYKIWDELRETIESTFFPIKLYFDGELVDTIEAQKFENGRDYSSNGRYRYKWLPDYEMEVWDNQTSTRISMQVRESYEFYGHNIYFKGMELKSDSRFFENGIRYIVDFYGLDTKKTLTLDRKKIRKEAVSDIKEILTSATQFYLDNVESVLSSKIQNGTDEELNQIYTYWCIASLENKIKLLRKFKNIFENICVKVDVLKKKTDDEFTKEEIDFKDLMKEWEKVAVIWNLSDYISHTGVSEIVNDELILQLLNKKAGTIPFSMVIIDKNFAEMLKNESQNSIIIIPDEKHRIYLESFTTEKHVLPEVVDSATKEYLLSNLFRKRNSEKFYTFHRGAIRRFMIGLKDYEKISTTVVPFGVDGDGFRGKGYIISPVTIEQWEQNRHLNRDAFIDQICAGTAFANLVDHVYEHSFCEPEKEEIENEYKRFTGELYDIAKRNKK